MFFIILVQSPTYAPQSMIASGENPLSLRFLNTTSPHFLRPRMIPDACAAHGTAHADRRAQRHEQRATDGGQRRLRRRTGYWRFFFRAACAGAGAGER